MKLAAIIYGMGQADGVDAMLSALAAELRGAGFRLAGAVQHNTLQPQSPCSDMIIEDLATGRRIDISTPLAIAGGGCRLDAAALEDVAGIVAAGLEPGPASVDLVIVNRFGKQEMAGNGFRGVIEQAVAREIPLLIALNGVHRPQWDAFTGGHGDALPPTRAAVEQWCRGVLRDDARSQVHVA
jgi:nucleoside-triphosphatase THEP1